MLKRRLKEPFGKAGLTVAILALVLAMAGGAFAAGGGLSGKQKKEVEKIAKKVGGKPGPAGATGPAGPAGKAGSNGTGTNGTNGTNGTAGTNGTNGTTGFTKKLPSGETETGNWSASAEVGNLLPVASVSFSIPVQKPLDEEHVFFIRTPGTHAAECAGLTGAEKTACEASLVKEEEAEASNCLGSAEAPRAAKGDLCVYAGFDNGLLPHGEKGIYSPSSNPISGTPGAGESGAILVFEQAEGFAYGSWAVTAP
jgi:hypothetical protein